MDTETPAILRVVRSKAEARNSYDRLWHWTLERAGFQILDTHRVARWGMPGEIVIAQKVPPSPVS
jgi:hypothetical protein